MTIRVKHASTNLETERVTIGMSLLSQAPEVCLRVSWKDNYSNRGHDPSFTADEARAFAAHLGAMADMLDAASTPYMIKCDHCQTVRAYSSAEDVASFVCRRCLGITGLSLK